MNERIQQLAWAAEDYADSIVDQGGEFHQAYTRKLAELIVKECCQKLENDGMVEVAMEMKQHFGVDKSQGWVCPKCGTDRTKYACPRGNGAAVDGSCPMFGVAQ